MAQCLECTIFHSGRGNDPTLGHPLIAADCKFPTFTQRQCDSRLHDGSLTTKIAQLFRITNEPPKFYTGYRRGYRIFYCKVFFSVLLACPESPEGAGMAESLGLRLWRPPGDRERVPFSHDRSGRTLCCRCFSALFAVRLSAQLGANTTPLYNP